MRKMIEELEAADIAKSSPSSDQNIVRDLWQANAFIVVKLELSQEITFPQRASSQNLGQPILLLF